MIACDQVMVYNGKFSKLYDGQLVSLDRMQLFKQGSEEAFCSCYYNKTLLILKTFQLPFNIVISWSSYF